MSSFSQSIFSRACGVALVCALALAPLVSRSEAEAPIDFARVNTVIGLVVEAALAENPEVSRASISFDPARMNLETNRVAATVMTGLRKTSWSENETVLTLNLDALFTPVEREGMLTTDIRGSLALALETEAVPALRYASGLIRSLLDCEGNTADPASDTRAFFCAQLSEMEQVTDLGAVAVQLASSKEGLLRLLSSKIRGIEAALVTTTDPVERARLEAELAEAQASRSFTESLHLEFAFAVDGSLSELSLDAPGSLTFAGITIDNLNARLGNSLFALGGDLNLPDLLDGESFARYRARFVELMRGLETGTSDALNQFREVTNIVLALVVGYTNQ